MAARIRKGSVRNAEGRADAGGAATQAWIAARLDSAVSVSVDAAMRAALNPANRMPFPLWWMPPADVASAESLAGEAGMAVAEMEDVSAKLDKRARKLPVDNKADTRPIRQGVVDDLGKALSSARAAKNKVAGAAAAAKKFKDARADIVAAEASFDAAEDDLDDYKSSDVDNGNVVAKTNLLKNAAQKIKADVDHLKDALGKIAD